MEIEQRISSIWRRAPFICREETKGRKNAHENFTDYVFAELGELEELEEQEDLGARCLK